MCDRRLLNSHIYVNTDLMVIQIFRQFNKSLSHTPVKSLRMVQIQINNPVKKIMSVYNCFDGKNLFAIFSKF